MGPRIRTARFGRCTWGTATTVGTWLSLAVSTPIAGQTTVELEPWLGALRSVPVVVGGDTVPFLLDTGAGLTVLDRRVAEAIDCRPRGRTGGHRSNGAWVAFEECHDVRLTLEGVRLDHRTVGVWDLVGFLADQLPEGMEVPVVGGVLSLASFANRAVTLDLEGERLTLETRESLAERVRAMTAIDARFGTGEGTELNVFVSTVTPGGPLWLKLDSGNVDRTLLDLHAASLLGLEDVPAPVAPSGTTTIREERTVRLDLAGLGPQELDAAFTPLTIDGLAGVDLMRRFVWTFDLAGRRVWAVEKRQPAP